MDLSVFEFGTVHYEFEGGFSINPYHAEIS